VLSLLSLQTLELESLLLGLERRLAQLNKDVSILETENDGELYGVLSLYMIENERTEIRQLIEKLNSTMLGHSLLTNDTVHQVNLQLQYCYHPRGLKSSFVNVSAEFILFLFEH